MFLRIGLILILSVWWLAPASAGFARIGSGSTGGGFVVDCAENPVSPELTQVLDLFEMEDRGYSLATGGESLEREYWKSADRTYTLQGRPDLAEELKNDIKSNFLRLVRSVKFVENESELPVADDLGGTVFIPSQCEVKQVALFDFDLKTVFVLKSLWNKLDTFNQAALLQHELWGRQYKIELGETTSVAARQTVGTIFTEPGQLEWPKSGLPNKSRHIVSTSEESKNLSAFYMYEKYDSARAYNMYVMQFTHFFGRTAVSKTWANFLYIDWEFEIKNIGPENRPVCVVKSADRLGEHSSYLMGDLINYTSKEQVKLNVEIGKPLKMIYMKHGEEVAVNYLYNICRK